MFRSFLIYRYLSWVDFDASKKKGINRPFFTYLLLFTCTITLIASFGVNGWQVEPLDVNPMIGPSAETLIKMGAKDSYLIVNANEAWRLVSSIILHAGLVHFFINMMALWFVGSAIETCHGLIAATILFIIPATGGTILSAIFLPEYITVGASGGIFGYIGACLADIIMNWKLLFCDFVTENGKKHRHVMVVVFLLLDIVLNCLIGLTPYVDNFTRKYERMNPFLSSVLRNSISLRFCIFVTKRHGRNDLRVSLRVVDNGTVILGFFRHGAELLVERQANLCPLLWSHCQCHYHLDHHHHFA